MVRLTQTIVNLSNMATNFPTSLDTLTNPTGSNTLDSPDHAAQHANANDGIEALQAKVGVDSSAVTTSHDYKLSLITGSTKAVSASDLTGGTETATLLSSSDGNTGAILEFYQDSASPASQDGMGLVKFFGENASSSKVEYARITGSMFNTTAGAETGGLIASIQDGAGSLTQIGGFGRLGLVSALSTYLIADVGENEIAGFTDVDSAVNYIEFTNSVTTNPLLVQAKGDDSNVDIRMEPKGAGVMEYYTDEASATGFVSEWYHDKNGSVSDTPAQLKFFGKDNGGNKTEWSRLETIITDPSGGSESSTLAFYLQTGGSLNKVATFGTGGGIQGHNPNGMTFFDNNGNELVDFPLTGAAVNYAQISSSATGVAVDIAAVGDDTNIDLELTPKGSGDVKADGAVVVTQANDADVSAVNTGTSSNTFVTPDSLAGSNLGERTIEIVVFDSGDTVTTGDGAAYAVIPSSLDGMNLVEVFAGVSTAGTTGTTDIQIHNVSGAADMLSTKITIDSGEQTNQTAATPAVIDTANDDVSSWEQIRIDVDAVSTTPPQGLIVALVFRLP